MSESARALYEALRALEHRARTARRKAGQVYSRRETASEAGRLYGVELQGQRISAWLPDDPVKAQIPRDGEAVWAIVRVWSDWAGDPAPHQRYWSDLLEAAQPHPAPNTSASGAPGRPLREFTDPLALEVHPAVELDDIEPDAHAPDLPSLPAYIVRDHDARLAQAVDQAARGRSTIAVLVGGSSTGKTRACWEAVHRLPDDWRLWHPVAPSPAQSILDQLDSITPRTVLWLNETQHYLLTEPPELGERVAAELRELLRDPGRAPVLVLGTMWPDYWAQVTAGSARLGGHDQARALLTGSSIEVPETFSESAMDAVRTAADPRLAYAARHAEDGQISQYLAGVPVLLERYRTAPAAAKALIHAAMDARRLRHGQALPYSVLAAAAPGYLTDRQWEAMDDDWVDQALAYTAEPCRGVRGPLTPIRSGRSATGQGFYRLADYLERIGYTERRTSSIPAELWDALRVHSAGQDLFWLGDQAHGRGLYRIAFQFYSDAAEAGDGYALSGMWRLLMDTGRTDEAITWFQARVDAGDAKSLTWLATLLRDSGRTEEAMAFYRRSVDNGSVVDMDWLAGLLRKAGRVEEALALYQQAIEAYDPPHPVRIDIMPSSTRVVDLMIGAGRTEEVLTWLKARVEAGNGAAGEEGAWLLERAQRYEEAVVFNQLVVAAEGVETPRGFSAFDRAVSLLRKLGRVTDDAISTYQQVAEAPDIDPWLAASAMYKAVELLREANRIEDAIDWLKRREAAGHRTDYRQLVELMRANDQTQKAIMWLEGRARKGDPFAVDRLADVLVDTGRIEEAIGWLKTGAEAGVNCLPRLTRMLREQGRLDEAISFYQRLADRGATNPITTNLVRREAANLLRAAGRIDEAIAILPTAAIEGNGSESAGLRLLRAELLREAGRGDEAITWLAECSAAGDEPAADRLIDLLVQESRHDEAISRLKHRAAAGSTEAALKAATMLRAAGRVDELITWLDKEAHAGWGALMQAADALRTMGRIDEAVAFYQRAADASGDVSTSWIQAAGPVIELQKDRGRIDEAIGWLKAQVDAGEVRAVEELSMLLYQAGRIEEALTFCGRTVESGRHRGAWFLTYAAHQLRADGHGEFVDRVRRYGIEPGGSPARPWTINTPQA